MIYLYQNAVYIYRQYQAVLKEWDDNFLPGQTEFLGFITGTCSHYTVQVLVFFKGIEKVEDYNALKSNSVLGKENKFGFWSRLRNSAHS